MVHFPYLFDFDSQDLLMPPEMIMRFTFTVFFEHIKIVVKVLEMYLILI